MKKVLLAFAVLAPTLVIGSVGRGATLLNPDDRVYVWRSPEAFQQMVRLVNEHEATPSAIGPLLACVARNGAIVPSGGLKPLVRVSLPSSFVLVGNNPCSGWVVSEDIHLK